MESLRPLAVVTGASSGIGYHLARECAEHGYDLLLAADRLEIVEAAQAMRQHGVEATSLQVDLGAREGVEALIDRIDAVDRPVDALIANAGLGLGRAFVDQDVEDIAQVIDTNITGTVYLLRRVLPAMIERGRGKVLITGSIAGLVPGSFQAVYNGSKAFLDSFAWAVRNELKDTGVTVTCLMPGPTETEFFERAGLQDTRLGQDPHKADPADVARAGFEAMQRGDGDVVVGFKNKLQAAMAAVTPQGVLAEQHRKMAEPRGGQE
jgi:short-subunit dehydrogenase